jgi:hypothetical protein
MRGRSDASWGGRNAQGTVRVTVPWPDGPMRVFDLEQPRTAEMPIHPAHQEAGYSYCFTATTRTSTGPK